MSERTSGVPPVIFIEADPKYQKITCFDFLFLTCVIEAHVHLPVLLNLILEVLQDNDINNCLVGWLNSEYACFITGYAKFDNFTIILLFDINHLNS